MNIKTSFFAVCSVLLAACSADNDVTENSVVDKLPSKKVTFTANIDVEENNAKSITRTALGPNNAYPIWSVNDKITVLNTVTQDQQPFDISEGDAGKRAATFTGDIKVDNKENKYYALYGGTQTTLTLDNGAVTFTGSIPASQSTTTGFHPEYHYMTACTEGNAFHFKNTMSMFHVNISSNDYDNFKICKIVLTANNTDEIIAGTFTATIDDNGVPTISSVIDGSNTVTIGNGTEKLSKGDYYIAILPCAFSEGFTLTFLDENDKNVKQYDRSKSGEFPVVASEIINLGSYSASVVAKEAYVDLGIGTKWAIQNIQDGSGNVNPGGYFAWGETITKDTYSWKNYAFGDAAVVPGDVLSLANTTIYTFTYSGRFLGISYGPYYGVLERYNSKSSWTGNTKLGNILDIFRNGDNRYELMTNYETAPNNDDVAYSISSRLRIPSESQVSNLLNKCTFTYDSSKKVYVVTGSNSHYIELPAKGYFLQTNRNDTNLKNENSAYYWTRERAHDKEDASGTNKGNDSYLGISMVISGTGTSITKNTDKTIDRAAGMLIRAVVDSE